ncbi:MAG TPA: translational GTPase TypA [Candidatus Onthousia faecipullorum]|uniref:Large ribosomal subunit assembly factor BipA n=1 Tax=Candidatus Onthousia faecipullorum TaxID=2840887 RepID=A0A9D1KBE2_9FIRM|nr:translational GTPase TypA [Candidatus Onthousia faecipullorum]
MKKRNVAIIAHVDHGKTTLVDGILKTSGMFRDNEDVSNVSMDSNALEKERGITILAKTTALDYNGYRINILDTPGHADFGGEVERIMNMVDGVILVVDAYEGAMPQTRFVLKKAFEAGVKPIVVINKVDKPSARCSAVVDEVLDLFIELGADEDQLDFPVVYASALNETCSLSDDISMQEKGFEPLLDLIIEKIPAPTGDNSKPLQFQPALLDYNEFVGRIGIGRVHNGIIKTGEMVSCLRLDGTVKNFRIQKLFGYYGYNRIEINEAEAGDIVAIAGLADISVGETICNMGDNLPLPVLHIDEPTLQMTFGTNSSPFVGRDGKILTARKIEERLIRETQKDVSLRVESATNDSFLVSGRGELHLGILIENMRREGFELEVSKPKVIIKEIDGVKYEPWEDLQIEVPEDVVGSVIEHLGTRGGVMENMTNFENQVRLNYTIPSRGLIGFSTDFMTMTKGYGIMNHTFSSYKPYENVDIGERKLGVLVSVENGNSTAYSIGNLEDRGTMFIEPGTEVYEGMIIGECNRDNDLAVNVVKGKQLTNMRAAGSDHTVVLKRPRQITLEYALDYINSDELVEVTPNFIRLRKRILNTEERKKADAKKNK